MHGIEPTDYVIVTTEEFQVAAEQLANFHQTQDALTSEIVKTNQIFNEFSSGSQDVTAIRDFLKYLYDKSGGEYPKYVLLFGDASYDYKDRIENNTNFVPSFQTLESLTASASSVWDDYFTWMDEDEGTTGIPDFAIGRIPVKTDDEAQAAVNKIIHYATNSDFGSWKNSIMFTADDDDGNLHIEQADSLTSILSANFGELNIQKNYFDFFELSPTPGGPLYPEVTKNINSGIEEGLLILNYTGHGGFQSWGQEQVLTTDDIDEWQNIDRLPLMVAASCQFSVYDDPEIVSGGEMAVLKEDGGCIGIFGQVRLAYSQSNFRANQLIIDYPGSDEFKTHKRLGDIYRYVKLHTANQITTYSTHLLGDPAVKLTFPDFNIATTSVNGVELPAALDTINPGAEIIISGNILDTEGNPANNFNGDLVVTVYERPYIRQTLGNANNSYVTDVTMQDSVMMQLQAEVVNGQFEYTFTLPLDISQDYGAIKLSHYAFTNTEDASGYFKDIVIGGEPNAIHSNIENGDFSVYPTLAENKLTLVNTGNSDKFQTQIIDLSGKTILSRDFNKIITPKKIQLDVSALSPGFYILRVSSENGNDDFKFIKK
ncbi:MAG: type IX secretion system sortase PorU [Bacteroidales bacterium]